MYARLNLEKLLLMKAYAEMFTRSVFFEYLYMYINISVNNGKHHSNLDIYTVYDDCNKLFPDLQY